LCDGSPFPVNPLGSGPRRLGPRLPTLGGSVEMHIPAGAQSGQKAAPCAAAACPENPPGDQYVQLKVVLPPRELNRKPEGRCYEEMRRQAQLRSAREPVEVMQWEG